jgi:hypothetical protein
MQSANQLTFFHCSQSMDLLARMLLINQFVRQVSSLDFNDSFNHTKILQRTGDRRGKSKGLVFEASRKKGAVIFIAITPTLTLKLPVQTTTSKSVT